MEALGGKVQILVGDVRERLRSLPDNHFDCVVTSPPYWGLRDYGVEGQIGLERSLGEHLAVMVEVFEEVRRVLKPTGTCWINYGDCYATAPNGRSAADIKLLGTDDRTYRDKPFSTIGGVLKSKDLCMVPNRLAIVLQEAGWWVRSEIIWHKPNPMPESITDRPTTSHEKIWLLTKSERYWYDAEAIRESVTDSTISRLRQNIESQAGSDGANGGAKTNGRMKAVGRPGGKKPEKFDSLISGAGRSGVGEGLLTRNSRNVWTIATAAFSEAHFATFPPELAERCIKAGCPRGGSVLDPFGGSGTTGMVAASLGRIATLVELNPKYAVLAQSRIDAAFMGKEEGRRHMIRQLGKADSNAGPLFSGL